jgi:hypothetical protein
LTRSFDRSNKRGLVRSLAGVVLAHGDSGGGWREEVMGWTGMNILAGAPLRNARPFRLSNKRRVLAVGQKNVPIPERDMDFRINNLFFGIAAHHRGRTEGLSSKESRSYVAYPVWNVDCSHHEDGKVLEEFGSRRREEHFTGH